MPQSRYRESMAAEVYGEVIVFLSISHIVMENCEGRSRTPTVYSTIVGPSFTRKKNPPKQKNKEFYKRLQGRKPKGSDLLESLEDANYVIDFMPRVISLLDKNHIWSPSRRWTDVPNYGQNSYNCQLPSKSDRKHEGHMTQTL